MTQDNSPRTGSYIPTLDGWRCVAICSVLLFHGMHTDNDTTRITFLLGRIGVNGVLIFFAISGFLITDLLLNEEAGNGRISLRGFYIRRAFRILPPALTYLAVLVILGMFSVINVTPASVIPALFFFANYVFRGWFTAHFWSLSIEEHFYLFWPSIVAKTRRATAIKFAVAVIVFVGVLRVLVVDYNLYADAFGGAGQFLQHTEARADYLMFGALAAILLKNPRTRERYRSFLLRGGWWLCVALFLGASLIELKNRAIDLRSVQAVMLAAIVSGTAVAPSMLASRILELQPLRWIGKLSYSIYLWQELILQAYQPTVSVLHRVALLPVKLAIVIAIAWLSFRFIERPTTRFGRSAALKATAQQPKYETS